MDALKYAHHTLIEKIQQKKNSEMQQQQQQQHGHMGSELPSGQSARPVMTTLPNTPTSMTQAVPPMAEYCQKYDDAARHQVISHTPSALSFNDTPFSAITDYLCIDPC